MFSYIIHAEFKDDHDGSSTDMSEYDWEEESDEDLGSPSKMPSKFPISNRTHTQHQTASCPSRQSSKRHDPEITAIMHAMDQELARTDVGKSFEREPPRVCSPFLKCFFLFFQS